MKGAGALVSIVAIYGAHCFIFPFICHIHVDISALQVNNGRCHIWLPLPNVLQQYIGFKIFFSYVQQIKLLQWWYVVFYWKILRFSIFIGYKKKKFLVTIFFVLDANFMRTWLITARGNNMVCSSFFMMVIR